MTFRKLTSEISSSFQIFSVHSTVVQLYAMERQMCIIFIYYQKFTHIMGQVSIVFKYIKALGLLEPCGFRQEEFFMFLPIRRMAENGLAPPPREFCRHILSCRELKAESFKRCLHSVLRDVSL